MLIVPDGVKVISFDIFDTLIIRPFVRPTDLFYLIEKNLSREGFARERINAEKKAKKKKKIEVTLDEIYEEMDENKDLKEIEIDYELSLCMRNEVLCKEMSDLSQNYRIVLTSDMYLPQEVIVEILRRNGVEYSTLYLSSELGFTKCSGTMFHYVIEKEAINPQELFHIGDNKNSDYNTPKNQGINAMHVISPINKYFKNNPASWNFYKRHKSLSSSIIVAIDMIRAKQADIKKEIGSKYGGPLAYGYSKFVMDNVNKDATILFAARDGYSLIRIFELFGFDSESHYVYLQRIFNSTFYEKFD